MSTLIRSGALAIGATVLALSAQAGPTLVDFNSLTLPTSALTLAVTDQITGFTFSGANAYGPDQLSPGGFDKPDARIPESIYVMSLERSDSGSTLNQTISVTLSGANAAKDIELLDFDSWIFSNSLQVFAYEDGTRKAVGAALSGSGKGPFGTRNIDLSLWAGKVNRIDFTSDPNTLFALDNLRFAFSATGPGPGPSPVPEPGSYGLVALALAAASMASRRRRA